MVTPLAHAGSSLQLSGRCVWSWNIHFTSYATSGDLTVWGHEHASCASGGVRMLPLCFLRYSQSLGMCVGVGGKGPQKNKEKKERKKKRKRKEANQKVWLCIFRKIKR